MAFCCQSPSLRAALIPIADAVFTVVLLAALGADLNMLIRRR